MRESGSKETLLSSLPGDGRHFGGWRGRTHTTQLERREEEEREANLSRFGGCAVMGQEVIFFFKKDNLLFFIIIYKGVI